MTDPEIPRIPRWTGDQPDRTEQHELTILKGAAGILRERAARSLMDKTPGLASLCIMAAGVLEAAIREIEHEVGRGTNGSDSA